MVKTDTRNAEKIEYINLLNKKEDHFLDFKSKNIKPAKLQETFVSFANTDGGELYIGVEDEKFQGERICGFKKQEEANDILATLLQTTNPSVENLEIEFINFKDLGLVLHILIPKSPAVHYAANEKCFIRINASTREIKGEKILALGYAKGTRQYEKQLIRNATIDEIIECGFLTNYLERIDSQLLPENFLRKQRLVDKENDIFYPNVGCILLFDEEPQATLDTRCSIKLYRMRTTEKEYDRRHLESPPITINGNLEQLIDRTLQNIDIMLEDSLYKSDGKYLKLKYPSVAIKELIVNAIIHRDYNLSDDIHVIIYDDRIEIKSPGKLPGFITIDNIYDERYSRNPNIVRLLHKLPTPPNHDIGEGLNTVRNELRNIGLVPPVINAQENSVTVIINHTRISTPAQVIRDLFIENPNRKISNKIVREASGEKNINIVKKALQDLRKQDYIKPEDENVNVFKFKYILANRGKTEWINNKK